jgi:hypothetical protein
LEERPERNLPQSVDVLLQKMMAKRPEDRYQSMEQLIHDLERMKQGKVIGKAIAAGAALSTSVPPYTTDLRDTAGLQEPVAMSEDMVTRDRSDRRSALRVYTFCSLILFLSGGALFFFHTNPPSSKPIEVNQSTPDANLITEEEREWQRVRDIFQRCGKIKSEIVQRDGKLMKKFVFPDYSIGWAFADGHRPVNACGEQYLPVDKPLCLRLGYTVLFHPEVIAKIDPGEFYWLIIDNKQPALYKGVTFTEMSYMEELVIFLVENRLPSVGMPIF